MTKKFIKQADEVLWENTARDSTIICAQCTRQAYFKDSHFVFNTGYVCSTCIGAFSNIATKTMCALVVACFISLC